MPAASTLHHWIPMPDGRRLAARLWLPEGTGDSEGDFDDEFSEQELCDVKAVLAITGRAGTWERRYPHLSKQAGRHRYRKHHVLRRAEFLSDPQIARHRRRG
ncbi:hypothetical protein J4729_15790 [Leisingera sp. HS039]|uniref:hypothetical protein n=1 Tax=unclassified Leisingera TaxID=2614906 RepID=UPI0010712441|nr:MULTISPECIES: hypothetical protein [unclassified Leisingera]MBQ4826003.1 hypothetical protein [Leisingera sp. HS039]QBR38710.1 hypothetical protein ETW23_22815 [Leisingera sp. NJS201]